CCGRILAGSRASTWTPFFPHPPPAANHNRFKSLDLFPDGHLEREELQAVCGFVPQSPSDILPGPVDGIATRSLQQTADAAFIACDTENRNRV
ncbi:hypothetical protein, partial [Belnapia arida]|uniref:hypothetical protein n=1 Tax=Belnapia arida TaxID=2804533 RepID=UPI001F390930